MLGADARDHHRVLQRLRTTPGSLLWTKRVNGRFREIAGLLDHGKDVDVVCVVVVTRRLLLSIATLTLGTERF